MKKTVEYVVRTTENAITHQTQTVPVVVNRREPVDLVDVVANCIDRNLILGAKPTAAQGIAEGIAEQLAAEFKKGNGVKFGKYFYGRLYLDGTSLTRRNALPAVDRVECLFALREWQPDEEGGCGADLCIEAHPTSLHPSYDNGGMVPHHLS
jgi:hypothetical protein